MDKENYINSCENVESVSQQFIELGGIFTISPAQVVIKLRKIRAVIFDWDGVFNDGSKGEGFPSLFNEADSMGTNMLRYGLWRKNGRLPITAIISGENNRTAIQLALREHFDNVYLGVCNKRLAVKHLCEMHNLEPGLIASFIDDINDLDMAKVCGLGFLINRPASPLFKKYILENALCDYITGNAPRNYAVREVSELLLGLLGIFEAVVESRVDYDQNYQEYFTQRQEISTHCYIQEHDKIIVTTADKK